ncbi:hypothetical protein ACHAW6_001030 [Cyclotella cf. meneghiniana]
MKSCKTNELIKAYQTIHQCWKDSQVISVNWHILGNERPSTAIVALSNSPHPTCIDVTMQNMPSRLSRDISFLYLLGWTTNSQSMNGTAYYHRQSSLRTSSETHILCP